MLDIKNLSKTFYVDLDSEKKLFNNFSLYVPEKQFVSIIGSNGSGKTTLLNLISGALKADEGTIYVDGSNITNVTDYKRANYISRVFQNPSIGTCPSMTIFENMSLADNKLKPYNLTLGLNHKRKDYYRSQLELLEMGLENRMDTKAEMLSGGQRQALALIMATLVKPKLLLLDEHTAALDPKISDVIMHLTQKIVTEREITTLMVTHNLRYAKDYGDRAIMMHDGNIVFDLTGEQKEKTQISDYLKVFNEISIECGN